MERLVENSQPKTYHLPIPIILIFVALALAISLVGYIYLLNTGDNT
jgi:hypothetical protein